MAGDSSLKLSIVFAAFDKLTGPIERMRRGTRGLTADMAKTRASIKALGDTQKLVGAYKLQDAGYAKQAARVEEARAATAKLRTEIAATDQTTAKLARQLASAEKYEAGVTAAHEKQGAALQELSGKLTAAGVDVAQLGDHEARLARQLGDANTALENQKNRAAKLAGARAKGERLQAAGGKLVGASAAVSVGAGVPIAALLRESYNAAIESRDALGQVSASMAGMGGAAQRTLPQLEAQAKRLQHISTFDDDEILRGVTTSMLTFDKIAGPMFDRAQAAVVNLSAKFGKDLQSSSLMVGKALQNPLKGLTALTRLGVGFSAGQQNQIKAMVAAGNVAGAQALIMAELERQTAGAGQAARDAKPGSDTLDQWRDFTETTGASLITILPPLTAALAGLLGAFNALSPGTQTFLVGLTIAAVALGPLLGLIGGLVSIVGGVAAAFSVGLLPAIGIVLGVVAAVALLGYAAYKIYQNWGAISSFFVGLWNKVYAAFTGPLGTILTALFPFLGIPIQIYQHWGAITGFFKGVWDNLQAAVTSPLAYFDSLPSRFGAIGGAIMQGLLMAINPMLLVYRLIEVAKAGLTAFKNFFGIKSPSRVFMGVGGFMTEGLALGLDRGGRRPLRSLARLSAGLTGAAALALNSPSLANASSTASARSGAAAQAGAPRSVTFNVTIQLTGSGDPQADARAIKRELDRLLDIEARGDYRDE